MINKENVMKKVTILKMALLTSVMSLGNQSFTLVDSTTDNQLPSMREEWQNPRDYRCPYHDYKCPYRNYRCPYYTGEMEIDSDVDYQSNVKSGEYRDEHSDIEEIVAGGPNTGW